MIRRRNTALVAAGWLTSAVALAAAPSGSGQTYPEKPIRVIVPSQAGGGADIVARVIAQKLTDAWGQQVVIDNRIVCQTCSSM